MTPERMSRLVARWVRFYTRNLPSSVADRRVEEVDADLHDHVAHERARGAADGDIARAILARWLRGLAADVRWAGRGVVPRAVVRVAAVTAAVLLVPLIANPLSDGPGWSVGDFVLAAMLLGGSGVLLELSIARPRSLALRVVAVAIGVAAMVAGEADDAPGLVLFGCVLIAVMTVRAVRAARR